MIFLRILSFLAGSFVLLGAPFLLLAEGYSTAPASRWTTVLVLLAVLVFAFGYFFFALFAWRMARSLHLRQTGAGLVVFQLAAGAVLLATAGHTPAPLGAAPLLCFSVCLFMAFVWPGDAGRNHRRMRRRDGPDHYLSS